MLANLFLAPLADTTQDVVTFGLGLVGFLITLGITVGVFIYIRKPLTKVLEHLLGDALLVKNGVLLVQVLLVLAGLWTAFGAFYPANYGANLFIGDKFQFGEFTHYALFGLLGLASNFLDIVKWMVVAAGIFFVAYTVRGWRGPTSGQ